MNSIWQYWLKGILLCLLTIILAFGIRMLEWPCWQNPEYSLNGEMLLATHDAYHWLAGAEGFGRSVGHPMAEMLRLMAEALNTRPAQVAFWFPAVLASLVAGIVFAWGWALGSMEAGIAAGLIASIAPGFLARTLLGYYDTDLVTLFFPLLMTLAPASWAMRYMLHPKLALQRLALVSGPAFWRGRTSEPGFAPGISPQAFSLGNPLRWQWLLLLGISGLISAWTQEWHSVFPYLIRYNVFLLILMALLMAPRGRRAQLALGCLAYALPTLAGAWGCAFLLLLLLSGLKGMRSLRRFLLRPWILWILWALAVFLMARGEIFAVLIQHWGAYLKTAGDSASGAHSSLLYPSVAQSIIEVQDLSFAALFPYFHPWLEAALLGLAGFAILLFRRPGALFLLPLAALALLSTRLGGRMVMFGAPIVALGLSFPVYWILRRLLSASWRNATGWISCVLLLSVFVAPFLGMIPALSQGPSINRRHAQALLKARAITPKDCMLWLWWDWGYAAHYFARRNTIADGAQHGGPSLYLPAAVFATDNPRFARQLIRYTAKLGNEPGAVFGKLNASQAQALVESLASPETALVRSQGKQYLLVSFEMLRLGFWISNFGNWNFLTQQGEGGALSIVTQALSYKLASGEVRLEGNPKIIYPSSISVFAETGLTRRNYVQEWFDAHPKASLEEQQNFLSTRRNVNFLFNRVTDEKLAMDQVIYNSLMVQLLLGDPQNPLFAPYFKLVYDNVFARLYEVLPVAGP